MALRLLIRRVAPVLVAGAALAAAAPPAQAVPDCVPPLPVTTIATDQGRLESIVGDGLGRLFYTDLTDNRLLRIDGPGKRPIVLARDIPRPGGLAFDSDGTLVTGFSGGALSGAPGNGMAGMTRIDPETGAKQPFVQGLDQANGLARGPDGSFYTSNNISGEIVRVLPGGGIERNWATVESANGLVLDAREQNLFAAQTFTPAKIARIPLAGPAGAATYFSAPPADSAAGLDGLTRDGIDRLYVAANGFSEIWRVEAGGQACALARSLGLPSALTFGGGNTGFLKSNLYAVTFAGRVLELPKATDRPPIPASGAPGAARRRAPRLGLIIRPRRIRAGRRTRLRFRVTVRRRQRIGGREISRLFPVPGARVRLGRRVVVTGPRGRAALVHRFRRIGRVRVRASRAGYRSRVARIRVRPRRKAPRRRIG